MELKQLQRLDGAACLVGVAAMLADLGWLVWALATGFSGWPPVWFWLLAVLAGLMILGATPCLTAWSHQRRVRLARDMRSCDEFQKFVENLEPISSD